METKWLLEIGVSFLVLFVGGMAMCFAITFYMCQKVGVVESVRESALFAMFPALVPGIVHFVPIILLPFENVLRDSFGVAPEKAGYLGMGYIMMLLSWITGARLVGTIQKAVCVPTVDEVTEFKKHFQKKAAATEAQEEARSKTKT